MFTVVELQSISHVAIKNMGERLRIGIKRVNTDSRVTKRGDLFIALRGATFNGNDFVERAYEQGAVCAIVDEQMLQSSIPIPMVIVRDTTQALGELARLHRRKFSLPVIAITGSSGKTTTKEMIRSVLHTTYNVLCTQGNLNNHFGVPQTLFGLNKKHEIAIIEMGMNHSGEIKYLCEIAEPTHGVITNVGKAHLEFFKNIEGIAEAKGELFDWLSSTKQSLGFVNIDDKHVAAQAKALKKKITFSEQQKKADVSGTLERVNRSGCAQFSVTRKKMKSSIEVHLKTPGIHNVSNALAAAAIGYEFNISPANIKKGLERFKPVHGRMEVIRVGKSAVVDDAYNANPESMQSALRTLSMMECSGRRIAVLGDMLELGTTAATEHRKLGAMIEKFHCDVLLTLGVLANCIYEMSTITEKYHFADREKLKKMLNEIVQPGDLILVKGSHGMHMNEIVDSVLTTLRGFVK